MKRIIALISILFFIVNLNADVIKTFSYSVDKISMSKLMDYDQVFYEKFDLTAEQGNPKLPFEISHLANNIESY